MKAQDVEPGKITIFNVYVKKLGTYFEKFIFGEVENLSESGVKRLSSLKLFLTAVLFDYSNLFIKNLTFQTTFHWEL